MTIEDEIRTVLLDDRRTLVGPPDSHERIMRAIRYRRRVRVVAGTVAGVVVVALAIPLALRLTDVPASRPIQAGVSTATQAPSSAIPAVPWIATPAPSGGAAPTTTVATSCKSADLATTAKVQSDHLGISQEDAANVTLRNVGARSCTLAGRPDLLTKASGAYQPLATAAALLPSSVVVTPATIRPGQSATVQLAMTEVCNGGVRASITSTDLALSIAGDAIPIPGLKLSGSCPKVSVTPWFMAKAQPNDPYAGLVARIADVGRAAPGLPLSYVVELTNGSDQPVSFDSCPGYAETILKTRETYQLNCQQQTIAPAETTRLAMQISVPANAPDGDTALMWELAGADNFDAVATATVSITG